MTKRKPTIYVRDDLGHAWYFADGSIRLVLAELDGDVPFEENGYPCSNLEEGIALLNDEGYITGTEYDENDADDYFDLKKNAEDWND